MTNASSSEAVAACGCGRVYATATWGALPFVGPLEDFDDDGSVGEMRNCACGSTIAAALSMLDCTDGEADIMNEGHSVTELKALYIVTRNGQERIEVREVNDTGTFGLWSPRRYGWTTPEMGPDSCYATADYAEGEWPTADAAYAALENWARS